MTEQKKFDESLFGIDLFSWEGWDDIGDGNDLFFEVQWAFDSMKKYNGHNIYMYYDAENNGKIEILSNKYGEEEIIWSGYIIEIPEFKEEIMKKFIHGQIS